MGKPLPLPFSGISWAICKSFAPHSRQITTPIPQHSVFTGRMPFLPPSQQHQSSEGIALAEQKTFGGWAAMDFL